MNTTKYKDIFNILRSATYRDVPGVFVIEGTEPGPTVGISICTHGNEIAGLSAAEYLLDLVNGGKELKRGGIYIVLNNLKAAEHFFDLNDTQARFVDIDFNRLPPSVFDGNPSNDYEITRARVLKEVWDGFDYGIDMHSTTLETTPLIIAPTEGLRKDVLHGIPIHTCISNITHIQKGVPAMDFYGRGKAYTVGVECGSHYKQETFDLARESVLAFLANLDMLDVPASAKKEEYTQYDVFDSIIFPNDSYELVKLFRNFEFIPEGALIATGDGPSFRAQKDCYALMASKKKPSDITSEALFLALPPQTYTF